ncbi:PLP-dependent cysteine synthase family protein [Sphingomonas sp. H160509]|nr:pyridoxal-phosphate dependent enzyme [Sphingomonas sp. H160509]
MTGKRVDRRWLSEAVRRIEADYNRSADTHLIRVNLPRYPGIVLYLKDESSHPTGSLKHRLARSLFLYALCNEWIGPETTVIESSSGSTAVSEAYFARMLGLRFIAVVPATTAKPKLDAIRFHGGEIHMVDDPRTVYAVSHRLAAETGGHYLDQFTYAERATDWRGNNNIAESIFAQMAEEEHPCPSWIVCGAGTGGTSATIGRFIRYCRHDTKLCVADPVHSVFHRHFEDRSVVALPEGVRVADRGDRAAARRAELRAERDRPDDRGRGRRQHRCDARAVRPARPARRRLDRDQPVGLRADRRGDGGGGRDGEHRHAVVRWRRPLWLYLLRRFMARRSRGRMDRSRGADDAISGLSNR